MSLLDVGQSPAADAVVEDDLLLEIAVAKAELQKEITMATAELQKGSLLLKEAEAKMTRLIEKQTAHRALQHKVAAVAGVVESKDLYCHCQKPWLGEFMIECDNCKEWFHPGCVKNITE
jgi:hypothetical protein